MAVATLAAVTLAGVAGFLVGREYSRAMKRRAYNQMLRDWDRKKKRESARLQRYARESTRKTVFMNNVAQNAPDGKDR